MLRRLRFTEAKQKRERETFEKEMDKIDLSKVKIKRLKSSINVYEPISINKKTRLVTM